MRKTEPDKVKSDETLSNQTNFEDRVKISDEKRCSYNDITYIFISQVSEDVFVVSRIADESSLEESDVEDGGVEVDELEEKNFEGQVVVELRLGPVHL